MIKESKFNWCQVINLHYAELLHFSLKEDLVNNSYSLFAEEVISKPQYAEEFIKSFQFSLVTTLSPFECHKGRRVFVRNNRFIG